MDSDSSLRSGDLLVDPLLEIEGAAGERSSVTLPGLLARLSSGAATELTALQAHQGHALHAFVVQLAALALARRGETAIARDEAAWGELLRGLAEAEGSGPEAFTLVVGDLSKPAFLQPPVPEGTLDVLKAAHTAPSEELDVLVTAKNHDVKLDRIVAPRAEHWVFALVTLQTMQGFLGAGNYGIARMNGGFSSRPCVAYAREPSGASRFQRDVGALLETRAGLVDRLGFREAGGVGLVWTRPWDGGSSLAIPTLDPFFIEVCRRVRLRLDGDAIVAHRGASRAARVDAKEMNGNTGDPWTPVSREDAKALTLPEEGYAYARVSDLLLDDGWQAGAAGEPRPDGSDRLWLGQALVRGQGKTGGYHERWIPIPPRARRILTARQTRADLGARAKTWITKSADARRKVLNPALLTLLQGGPEKLNFKDERGRPYLERLDAEIDRVFFELLFASAEEPGEVADATFERKLVDLARAELEAAGESLPVPSARRWRAEALARRVFEGSARNHLKLAFQETESTNPPAETGATTT